MSFPSLKTCLIFDALFLMLILVSGNKANGCRHALLPSQFVKHIYLNTHVDNTIGTNTNNLITFSSSSISYEYL